MDRSCVGRIFFPWRETCVVSPPADEPQWQQHGKTPLMHLCGSDCFLHTSKDTHTHTRDTWWHIHAYTNMHSGTKHRWEHLRFLFFWVVFFVMHRGPNMLRYKLGRGAWTFIIHAFVLHTDAVRGERSRVRGNERRREREINNGDKSCLIRGEEKGWVTYDWSPAREICMAFPAARRRREELI